MADTLGSLCDKLTIVKLKLWHTEDPERLQSLTAQEKRLQEEIDEFVGAAISGQIPADRLTFAANKVYKKEGNIVAAAEGSIAKLFSRLADVNYRLWHVQEKVYEFDSVPMEEKDAIVKQLALLNLERNECVDKLDKQFRTAIERLPVEK